MDNSLQFERPLRMLVRRIPPQGTEDSSVLPKGFFPLRLIMQSGTMCVELSRPNLLLGRHTSADIRVPLPDVSRRHCRFLFSDGHWEVVDLDSLNGIYINGERLREAVLQDGDCIRIASLDLSVALPTRQLNPTRQTDDDGTEDVLRRIADVLPMQPRPQRSDKYRRAG